MPHLKHIRVAGFKSIRDQEIELSKGLNVLIGANGAGKSNLIEVFHLLHQIIHRKLQLAVGLAGGADQLLHFGRKQTEEIRLHFDFAPNAYSCQLVPTAEDQLIFGDEAVFFHDKQYPKPYGEFLGRGQSETALLEPETGDTRKGIPKHVVGAVESWRIYHFHDTSSSSKIKQKGDLGDNVVLRPDAGNLAAFLYRLRETRLETYRNIVDTVRMVAPFFDDFDLRPDRLNPEKIRLEWREKGSDSYFNAAALSDGTLRFISLATLLLQRRTPLTQGILPTTILVDEPELGLHPYAITVLAELLSAAAEHTQVVVSTQSVTLVNQLSPEDVIVVDRQDGESIFRRLSSDEIASWLDDYSLGELWEKNVLGGRPGG